MNDERLMSVVKAALAGTQGSELKDLAQRLGVTSAHLRRYKAGQTALPMTRWSRFEQVLDLPEGKLAEAAGVSRELVDGATIGELRDAVQRLLVQARLQVREVETLVDVIDRLE